MIVSAILLAGFALFLSSYVTYQLALFVANALIADSPAFEPKVFRRFNVVIPAHDEELYLPRLLATLQAQDYPRQRYRVTVIADNCADTTAAVARRSGVDVLERSDCEHRGKGHAIRWALDRFDVQQFDAIVIIDGDSQAGPGLLNELNLQLERGDRVIQCYNGVANPDQSWFTRLMNVSRTISNDILHPGKRKLGLSSHLMGNGMCFDLAFLKSVGWQAFSVGEDWEYYATLIMSGAHVGYSRQARVYHQESVDLRQASSQRLRWSSGRFQVLRRYGPILLRQGVRTRSLKCLDAALPLVFPNPSLGINLTFVGLMFAGVDWLAFGRAYFVVWFTALVLVQLGMFIVGILHTENRAANALTLVLAPAFLVWKMGIDVLSFCGIGPADWKRTERRLS